jgi:hypothetical protein
MLLFCAACQGSASMRIDVEVYKGPLSKEPMIQLGDLLGFLAEVQRGLKDMNEFTNAVALNKDFKNIAQLIDDDPAQWCVGLDAEGAWDQMDYFDCILLTKLRRNNDYLLKRIATYCTDLKKALVHPTKTSIELLLINLSKIAGTMRKNPFSWTIPGTAGQTPNFKVRIAMVIYIVATAEYGNQLHARIDALMKQLADGGYDRKELPLSVYLSDTEPTDFVHLFDLWDAATDRSWAWLMVAAIDGTVKDRINMVKRLFADHHWSKINTAYASGWGKTKMAFVKDDIGNWNLKNFDNAPEELLNAYTTLAKTALDKAATLAMDINSGGSASTIKTLVNLSRSITMPTQGANGNKDLSSQFIEDLHHRTENRLRETAWVAITEESKETTTDGKQKVQKRLIESMIPILKDHGELIDLSSKNVTP